MNLRTYSPPEPHKVLQQEGTKKRSNGKKKRNFIPKQNTHDLLVGTLSIGIPSNFSKNCDLSNFAQFLEKSQKLQKSQFLLPPLPLEFSSFSKNCDFSIFSQFFATACKLGHISMFYHDLTCFIIS